MGCCKSEAEKKQSIGCEYHTEAQYVLECACEHESIVIEVLVFPDTSNSETLGVNKVIPTPNPNASVHLTQRLWSLKYLLQLSSSCSECCIRLTPR